LLKAFKSLAKADVDRIAKEYLKVIKKIYPDVRKV
jgi:hypothetical protein